MRLSLALLTLPAVLAAQQASDPTLARIRDEGLNHSHAYAMLDTIALPPGAAEGSRGSTATRMRRSCTSSSAGGAGRRSLWIG